MCFEGRPVQIDGSIGEIVSELRPQAGEKHQRLTYEVARNLRMSPVSRIASSER